MDFQSQIWFLVDKDSILCLLSMYSMTYQLFCFLFSRRVHTFNSKSSSLLSIKGFRAAPIGTRHLILVSHGQEQNPQQESAGLTFCGKCFSPKTTVTSHMNSKSNSGQYAMLFETIRIQKYCRKYLWSSQRCVFWLSNMRVLGHL